MISKGSRFGVGSLIRYRASDGPKTVSGDLRLFIFINCPGSSAPKTLAELRKLLAMGLTVLTEEEATSLLRAGNEKGLSYFFHQYDTALTWFALRITGDEATAEDIVAGAFITLWENREKLYRPASVKPYLYQVVRNASIGYLRIKKRQMAYQKEAVYLTPIAEEQVLRLEIETKTHQNLYETIQKLPPRMGQIFRMFYFQRKSLAQIAAELEISVNTVRNQKAKALLSLRKSLSALLVLLASFFL